MDRAFFIPFCLYKAHMHFHINQKVVSTVAALEGGGGGLQQAHAPPPKYFIHCFLSHFVSECLK